MAVIFPPVGLKLIIALTALAGLMVTVLDAVVGTADVTFNGYPSTVET